MSGFRVPEISRDQMVIWEHRLEDALPADHQVRHLNALLGSAAVDEACGAMVGADVNDEPDDSGQLTPMVDQVVENCGSKPSSVSADSQYNTGPELAAMEERRIDCYLPDAGQNSEAARLEEAAQAAQAMVRGGRSLSTSQWSAPRLFRQPVTVAALMMVTAKRLVAESPVVTIALP